MVNIFNEIFSRCQKTSPNCDALILWDSVEGRCSEYGVPTYLLTLLGFGEKNLQFYTALFVLSWCEKKVSDDDVPENMHKCHGLVVYVNSFSYAII